MIFDESNHRKVNFDLDGCQIYPHFFTPREMFQVLSDLEGTAIGFLLNIARRHGQTNGLTDAYGGTYAPLDGLTDIFVEDLRIAASAITNRIASGNHAIGPFGELSRDDIRLLIDTYPSIFSSKNKRTFSHAAGQAKQNPPALEPEIFKGPLPPIRFHYGNDQRGYTPN